MGLATDTRWTISLQQLSGLGYTAQGSGKPVPTYFIEARKEASLRPFPGESDVAARLNQWKLKAGPTCRARPRGDAKVLAAGADEIVAVKALWSISELQLSMIWPQRIQYKAVKFA